jgi:hypothetical protein
MYAIRSQYDVTLGGKAGWFSFFFQAKDRKAKERTNIHLQPTTRAEHTSLLKRRESLLKK